MHCSLFYKVLGEGGGGEGGGVLTVSGVSCP